ncbi:hypothetical protein ASPCAL01764 [Aspergillus calidoustus]|uniref:Uncharacterized protein n=1 Tax=Aspergillus calidoustus TaxID=454130 RepID=A0A0U5GMX2_ASPCI|nr:hypothetical protein ASPCAL01764 [Aspergillus calidoustus]
MDRTAVKINVRDANGRKDSITLDAVIDETIGENIIMGQWFAHLQRLLALERTPSEVKIVMDSHGVQHNVSSVVYLLIGQSGKNWSEVAAFSISDSKGPAPGGRYPVLLGNSLKARFSLPRADGMESFCAAPTVMHYPNQQERKQREDDAERNNAELRRKARENQEKLDKQKKDRKDSGNGQPGQSASTA